MRMLRLDVPPSRPKRTTSPYAHLWYLIKHLLLFRLFSPFCPSGKDMNQTEFEVRMSHTMLAVRISDEALLQVMQFQHTLQSGRSRMLWRIHMSFWQAEDAAYELAHF